MNAKLYVGNLNYTVTNDELSDLFSQAGKVISVVIIKDHQTDRSKGFGFVEMSSEEEAKKAIEMFNDKTFENRNIVVNEARPRVSHPRYQRNGDSD